MAKPNLTEQHVAGILALGEAEVTDRFLRVRAYRVFTRTTTIASGLPTQKDHGFYFVRKDTGEVRIGNTPAQSDALADVSHELLRKYALAGSRC